MGKQKGHDTAIRDQSHPYRRPRWIIIISQQMQNHRAATRYNAVSHYATEKLSETIGHHCSLWMDLPGEYWWIRRLSGGMQGTTKETQGRSVRNNYIHEWAAEMRPRIQEEGITLSEYNKQSKVTVASAIKYRLQSMAVDQEHECNWGGSRIFFRTEINIETSALVWIVGWKLIKLIACGPSVDPSPHANISHQ